MTPDVGSSVFFYLLLLVLPVSAVLARRVPVLRTLLQLAIWGMVFGVVYVVVAQRERVDPYLERLTSFLNLSDQKIVGRETRIAMAPDGHFWARVTINGVPRRLLVDSGATTTALSVRTAGAAGLAVKDSPFPVILSTANGTITADTATVKELRLGDIVARDLGVVVSPAFGDSDVLGMNFLSRLKSWRVEGRTLILTPHHRQGYT